MGWACCNDVRAAWRAESIRAVNERRQMAAEERQMRLYLAELQAVEEGDSEVFHSNPPLHFLRHTHTSD